MNARPHILILMTDQQRADCLHCAGHPALQTPNLDRIAGEGMRFTQAVTVAPLCMPARASFASALYPHNHGVWGNGGELPENDETFFQLLQGAQYFTALVGKVHYYDHLAGVDLRAREGYLHGRGFNHVHETPGAIGSTLTSSYLTDEWERKGLWDIVKQDYASRYTAGVPVVRASPLPVDDVLDSYVGRKAVEFVDAYDDPRPMCLYVGFAGPHDPWDAPGSYATMYNPGDMPAPIPIPPMNPRLPDWAKRNRSFRVVPPEAMAAVPDVRANYYGKISLIDDRIGHILDAFQRRGWLDDLFVVFLADHGEMLGDHGRFRKGTFHESGIRIPFIMRLPGRIPPQSVTDALVENIDVFPTILEAVGCPPSARCLGRSLWPVLQRTASESNGSQLSEVEHHSEQQIMIRTRRHKLAVDSDWRAYMLYDLERDPCEQHNLAGDPAARELEDELRAQLRARLVQSRFSS